MNHFDRLPFRNLGSWLGHKSAPAEPEPNPTERPKALKRPKRVNLALQGGGAHGAFTWGVLDGLLADGRIEVCGITGASAGAVNGALLVDGLMRGGPQVARERLGAFWKAVSRGGRMPGMQNTVMTNILDASPIKTWIESMGSLLSPYDFNPLNINPLKELIEQFIDFEAIRTQWPHPLYVSATNVRTGKLRVFTREELNGDVIMASACLPLLFRTVEIDGEAYWDGGYLGNPPLTPFLRYTGAHDLLIVQINPLMRDRVPTSAREITNRINEITFNASLNAELRAIARVNRLLRNGQLRSNSGDKELRQIRVHRIVLEDEGIIGDARSRMKIDYHFFDRLHGIGQDAVGQFLASHFDDVGLRSTVDLSSEERVAPAA